MTRTALPLHGRDRETLCKQLLEMKAADVPLDHALMNLLVPYADDDIYDVGIAAQAMFGHENALFARVIPSVDRLQTEVLDFALSLQNAPDGAGAAITSGGTESIFCACLAARELARAENPGLTEPEIVIARTAMIVGSAPGYSHGLFDPISALSTLALERGVWLHVDACVGGYVTPFQTSATGVLDRHLETTLSAERSSQSNPAARSSS